MCVTNPVRKRNAMKGARIHDLYILREPGPRVMLTLFGNEALLGERRLRPLNR